MYNRFLLFFTAMFVFPFGLSASVEVIGSLKQVFNTSPGETVKGQIKIQNSDSTDQEVRIYQTDLMYNFQDQTFYDEPGTNKRSNYKWIQYSPKTVILKAKEIRDVEIEILVPASDSIRGTYWSVLMIEGVSPIDPNQSGNLNIHTVMRYAVQLVNETSNKGKGALTFLPPTLIKDKNGKLELAVDLVNEGDHFIGPDVTMELYDENGTLVKKIYAPKRGIYPTTSARFKLDLADLPSKKTYNAMIVAAGQDEDIFGLEYTLYF